MMRGDGIWALVVVATLAAGCAARPPRDGIKALKNGVAAFNAWRVRSTVSTGMPA